MTLCFIFHNYQYIDSLVHVFKIHVCSRFEYEFSFNLIFNITIIDRSEIRNNTRTETPIRGFFFSKHMPAVDRFIDSPTSQILGVNYVNDLLYTQTYQKFNGRYGNNLIIYLVWSKTLKHEDVGV